MKSNLLVPVLIVVTLVACRNESSNTSSNAETTASQASATTQSTASVSPAATPYDAQFLDTMSKHHQGAIEMARIAQSKVQLPELKALTKRIPADQQKEIDQMKAWREQWYGAVPPAENMQMPGMSSSMNMDMSQMSSMKAGEDYDAMFIDMMIPHHEGAIQMSQDALVKAEHQEVKTLAKQIIDQQQKEIDQMKRWRSTIKKG